MPQTSPVTNILELERIKPFRPAAAEKLIQEFKAGKRIEKTESSFSDPGEDYVKFTVEGKTVCHISGY